MNIEVKVYNTGINYSIGNMSYQGSSSDDLLLGEFEGEEAYNLIWWYKFNNELTNTNKELIGLLHPEALEQNKITLRANNGKMVDPKLLASICMNNLRNMGLLKICTRCGGTGQYSRDSDGCTVCYKCKGFKYTFPSKVTKKLRNDIIEYKNNK